MWLLTLPSLLSIASCYYQKSASTTCSSLIYRCSYNYDSCSSLYSKYYSSCTAELESSKGQCSRKCRKHLGALMRHPQFALESFKQCDCQGETRCKRQKCRLLGCLDEPCTEDFPTSPAPDLGGAFSTLSSTPSGHSITMITSTVALDKVNCETVIVHCEKKVDCKVLLQARDRLCVDYTIENPDCSTKCRSANQLLRENFIGKHLTTCKFEIPKLESIRFTNLMSSCVPRNQHTQSPTYNTQVPSRPLGDCKRHYEECKADYTCNAGFNDVMRYCKTKTNGLFVSVCSATCVELVTNFTANPAGQALWGCSCSGSYVSRRCETIKHTLNDICSSTPCSDVLSATECAECSRSNSCKRDCGLMCRKTCNRCAIDAVPPATTDNSETVALTTFDASVHTTPQTKSQGVSISPEPSSPVSTFYVVNVSCEDGMNIRIDYSPEIKYSPHFAPEDKSCEVVATSPGSHSATMKLQYDPPNCGTQVRTGTGYRLARNKIYVRSISHPSYQEIRDIECRVPERETPEEDNMTEVREDTLAELRIYRDPEYTLGFRKLGGTDRVYLGDHKTVYGEIVTNNSQTFILQSCYATPNSDPLSGEKHFFIHNGCKMDSTFNMDNVGPANYSRFSFYRIMFQQKLSDEVYVHCRIMVCDESDPDCHLDCRYGNEILTFKEILTSQGPYTFPLALSASPRCSPWSWLLLILTVLK